VSEAKDEISWINGGVRAAQVLGARVHGEQGKRLRIPIGASAGSMPVKAAWGELEQHLAVCNLLIVENQDFQDDSDTSAG
jgi:hypothetical protein